MWKLLNILPLNYKTHGSKLRTTLSKLKSNRRSMLIGAEDKKNLKKETKS